MKHIYTTIGIISLILVAFVVSTVGAQSPQPGSGGRPASLPTPPGQSGQEETSSSGWFGGMHGPAMGSRMSSRMGPRAGLPGSGQTNFGPGMMQGHMGASAEGSMNFEAMMAGVTPMHEDAAAYLGMTSEELYNQMANGHSMLDIAKGMGVSERQLMDAIMKGRQTAYRGAVRGGYMTQAQADAMYQYMRDNVKTMVQSRGYGSSGWHMLWGEPTPTATAP